MFRKTLTASLTATIVLLASGAAADDREARIAAARSHLSSPAAAGMMSQMLSTDVLVAEFAKAAPNMTPAQRAEVTRIVAEELVRLRPQMEAAMLNAMVETFTLDEIVALDRFYRSAEGASVMRKMPVYIGVAMQQFAPALGQIADRASQALQ